MDHAGLPETGLINGRVLGVWDDAAVTSFGDSQTVDGGAGDIGDHVVQIFTRGIEGNGESLGEPPDGLACSLSVF